MIVIEGCAVATVDPVGNEWADGHLVLDGAWISAVGAGAAPANEGPVTRVDGSGLLATPGLVNTHHHLYQWLTRGLAQDSTLFGWLTTLYPIWAGIDAELVHAAAAANLGRLALSGCTTSTDHHYVFPEGGGDCLVAEINAATEIGIRFHPARGSMDLGASSGGLPPDSVVEDRDAILTATQQAIDTWHDTAPDAMVRVAVGPCSPFSVTEGLMRDSAELARRAGVRMHTHLAETDDEENFCRQTYGCSPAEYVEELGWLGDDVWLAHCVHLSDAAIGRLAATGTGVAHCPTSNGRLGAGVARLSDMVAAGVHVGLGVDGAASNEAGGLVAELHQSLLVARGRGGPHALSARQALVLGTIGGARCLGREAELGSLETGKLADVALWRVDSLSNAGIDDPVAALVFGTPVLEALYVGGRAVVEGGELVTADASELAKAAAAASATLRRRAGVN